MIACEAELVSPDVLFEQVKGGILKLKASMWSASDLDFIDFPNVRFPFSGEIELDFPGPDCDLEKTRFALPGRSTHADVFLVIQKLTAERYGRIGLAKSLRRYNTSRSSIKNLAPPMREIVAIERRQSVASAPDHDNKCEKKAYSA